MLQLLRHKGARVSRMLLLLLGVLWLVPVVQTCALAHDQVDHADDQTDHADHCCCDEDFVGCERGYIPPGEAPCPAMQAHTADRHPQGPITGERLSVIAATSPDRVVYPPAGILYPSLHSAAVDTPQTHPALRFRVLRI